MICSERSDEVILLNVHVFDLVYHSDKIYQPTLCQYSFAVIPSIKSILICTERLMRNVKIRYLHYNVAGDNFCGQALTGINPVTS